jgi:hypothetical protein
MSITSTQSNVTFIDLEARLLPLLDSIAKDVGIYNKIRWRLSPNLSHR